MGVDSELSRRGMWSGAAIAVVVGIVIAIWGGGWYINFANQGHPAAWPMVQGDSLGRFATSATFPADPQVLWSFPIEDPQPFPPAIGADGTVYVHTPTQVVAVGPDGKRKWAWKSAREYGWLALGRHGDVYVVGLGELIALDSQGRVQWRFALPEQGGLAPPLVGQGGVIYVSTNRSVLGITSDGKLKWEYTRGRMVSWPVETASGHLLVVASGQLRALDTNGEEAWSVRLPALSGSRFVAAKKDGTIYYRGLDRLYVLDERGQVKAEYPTNLRRTHNLAIGDGFIQSGWIRWSEDGTVLWEQQRPVMGGFSYVDAKGNLLHLTGIDRSDMLTLELLGPDASPRWQLGDMAVYSLPAIGADGRVCFAGQRAGEGPALICMGDK